MPADESDPQSTGPAQPAPDSPPVPEPGPRPRGLERVRDTRTARAWSGLILGAVILIVLLVFILQNLTDVTLQIFAWHFQLPLGVALLFAAIFGALLTALIGGARILQIRRAVKKGDHAV